MITRGSTLARVWELISLHGNKVPELSLFGAREGCQGVAARGPSDARDAVGVVADARRTLLGGDLEHLSLAAECAHHESPIGELNGRPRLWAGSHEREGFAS